MNRQSASHFVGVRVCRPRVPHLDSPEVTTEQQDDGHHRGDEATAEQLTQQVDEDGADAEEQVEERCHWMPMAETCSNIHISIICMPLIELSGNMMKKIR